MSSVIEEYDKSLDEQIDRIARHVLSGGCKDYPEYLAKIAEARAYNRAKDNFKYELDKYMRDEDNLSEDDDEE